ncbi:hypothetical protein [Pelagibaculum spongiae]|uniref:Cobalamin-independent methionine synthase MetE N-terminal domain-containing protein n=1 Tax=Pelagibaculum spongiae TaxID=2080658 RepID=A0A2V1GVY9_9GAMM|nr:hypothetical protein [Pelagibaculum spongiae]PVZ70565.1 hypothetical protein DC094_08265 [Pelagibaculum spongiae]
MSQSQVTQPAQDSLQQLTQLLSSYSVASQPSEIATITGPVSFMRQAQLELPLEERLSYLNQVVDQYCRFLQQQADSGQQWIRINEPAFTGNLAAVWWEALEYACSRLCSAPLNLLISGINQPAENLDRLLDLQADGIELDFTGQPALVDILLDRLPAYKVLSAYFQAHTTHSKIIAAKLEQAKQKLPERLWIRIL